MPDDLQIRRVQDTNNADLVALVAKSDQYLDSLYPPESNHAESLEVLVGDDSALFAGYLGEQLVACGAAKILKDDGVYGEIKRVFVAEEHRGKQLATAMMEHIEEHLKGAGITTVRLEAGPKQPAALNFYRNLGYVDRGPFGRYAADPLSVFMEKVIAD